MLVARVQAQEQRIMYLDRQRADVAARVAQALQARTAMAANVERLGDPSLIPVTASSEERRMIEFESREMKAQLAALDANLARLQTDEAEAINALRTEQGRWGDFNARLDELERSLTPR